MPSPVRFKPPLAAWCGILYMAALGQHATWSATHPCSTYNFATAHVEEKVRSIKVLFKYVQTDAAQVCIVSCMMTNNKPNIAKLLHKVWQAVHLSIFSQALLRGRAGSMPLIFPVAREIDAVLAGLIVQSLLKHRVKRQMNRTRHHVSCHVFVADSKLF